MKVTDDPLALAQGLAKVRCAEHISQRIKSPLPRAVSDLAYGRVPPGVILELQREGFVGWDNGSILTAKGAARLDEILKDRAKKETP